MTIKKTAIYTALLLLFSSAGTSQRAGAGRDADEVAIVVNQANPTEGLSLADVRRILMGERMFWAGNVQIRLVLRERGARERHQVLAGVLKMSDEDFDGHWRAKVFRGEAPGEPVTMPTVALVSQYVQQFPGALGFVPARDRTAGTKVLKLDGKLPGEPGYALR